MPADPAEPERRRRLVLLARDRLDGTSRRLGDLRAPPEDERDRGGEEGAELEPGRDRGQAEVDDEDRDEDRQAAEDLDVEPDQRLQRQELDRQQRPERDPDQRAADDGGRGDTERPRQAVEDDVVDDRLGPVGALEPRARRRRRLRRPPARAGRRSPTGAREVDISGPPGERAGTRAGGSAPTAPRRGRGRRRRAPSATRSSAASGC